MKTQSALRPEFFNNLPTVLRDQEKPDNKTEERLLYAMSNGAGWKVLEAYIDDLITDLDHGTEVAMSQGLPFEEIGRNAVVINLAKGVIIRIRQKVTDAREAVEDGTAK